MSTIYYGKKTIEDIDSYYRIPDESCKKSPFYEERLKECKMIQEAFNVHNIHLALSECSDLYSTWSDENYCAGWEGGLSELSSEDIFNRLIGWLNTLAMDRVNRLLVLGDEITEYNNGGDLGE